MKEITIQDVRVAIQKVARDEKTIDLLKSLNDEDLFKSSIGQDLNMFSGQVGVVIEQLGKDKHIRLPHELHKVLSDNNVGTIVETVNSCLREEEILGIDVVF